VHFLSTARDTPLQKIAPQALDIPSITATKCHIAMKPLQASPGFPTQQELTSNLNHCYPASLPPSNSGVILPLAMLLDELKVARGLWLDPPTDYILGICREHGDGNTHVTPVTWACLLGTASHNKLKNHLPSYQSFRYAHIQALISLATSSWPVFMASTTSLPDPTFTKPITSMTIC